MPRVPERASAAFAALELRREPEQLGLFGDVIDVASLRRERAAFSAAVRSASTHRAYASDWRDFSGWCDAAGRAALPASPESVALYLVHLVRRGRLPSTLARRCASIADAHARAGLASPIAADVRELLAGVGRHIGVAPRHAKAALSIEQLRALLGACGRGALGVRDRALLLLGFASGLRRCEISALDVRDLEAVPKGLIVRLRRSKTDQLGAGRELGVSRGMRSSTCPVRAVAAWLGVRGGGDGALFLRFSLSGLVTGERLRPAGVAGVVKRAAAAAGLDPRRFAGHSLRAGLATAAAEGGASDRAIMMRTGHRSSEMVSRYVRHGSLFASDPLRGAL